MGRDEQAGRGNGHWFCTICDSGQAERLKRKYGYTKQVKK